MEVNFSVGIKAIINTLIRMMPIGLYAWASLSSLVFSDFRATLILIGFIFNEMISLGYRMILRAAENPQCALLRSGDKTLTLPSPINQTIAFFVGFMMMDMYETGAYSPMRFFGLMTFLLIGMWSRINVGCSAFLDTLFSTVVGMIFGISYYYIVKPYYYANYLNPSSSVSSPSSTMTTAQSNFFTIY